MRKEGRAHPFAFVGCWNTRGPGRDAVLEALHTDPAAKHLLVLGGDNYYDLGKDKATGIKQHDPEVLREGFDALRDQPVLLSFGNHNIEKIGSFNVEAMQRSLAAAYNWTVGDGPQRYYRIDYDDVAFVVLDTNLCEPEKEAEFTAMLAWLHVQIAALKSVQKPYYIVQHEPIIAARQKKDKKTGEQRVLIALPFGNRLLTAMTEYSPLAILSADTHSYHEVLIYTSGNPCPFRQLIVGTGGAAPDKTDWAAYSSATFLPVLDYDATTVRIIPPMSEHQDQYGFLTIESLDASSFLFHPIRAWLPPRGGNRRTRRHRHRGSRRRPKFSRSR